MSKNNKKKVCIIVDCLTGGGAEKAAALLSKSLFKRQYEVSIISFQDDIDYDYKGELYNLGLKIQENSFIGNLNNLISIKRIYNRIKADIYLDFRVKYNSKLELLLHMFVFKSRKMVLTIHNYRLSSYIPKHKIFYWLYNRVKATVVVSEGILQQTKKLYSFKNTHYIPNFYSEDIIELSKGEFEKPYDQFIIAVGRLKNEHKQFDKLILAYKDSLPAKNKVPLCIFGEGDDRELLEEIIKKNKLGNIIKLKGFDKNPYPYIKASQFLILSSKYEGFGIVLIESLALGTPVISFDCNTGPSEIIQNNKNGILVKDQDFNELTSAINKMYSDIILYETCKKNSKDSVKKYSEEEVFKSWSKLINS